MKGFKWNEEYFHFGDLKTTYGSNEKYYEAIQIPWDLVERIIGRPHDGSEDADKALISALVDNSPHHPERRAKNSLLPHTGVWLLQ